MRASFVPLMMLLMMLLLAHCLALNLVEMKPLAAAMLAKRWATDQAELDQKVGIRDDGVTGVLRFGDDLKRRTEVAKTYDIFQKTSLALAAAAKGGGGATVCYAGHDPSGNHVVDESRIFVILHAIASAQACATRARTRWQW